MIMLLVNLVEMFLFIKNMSHWKMILPLLMFGVICILPQESLRGLIPLNLLGVDWTSFWFLEICCHLALNVTSPLSDYDFVSLVFDIPTGIKQIIIFWKIRIFVRLLKNWLIVICVFYLLSQVFRIGGSFWNCSSKRNRSSSLIISGEVYVKNKCF